MSNELSELRARLESLAAKWANNHNELSAYAECADDLRAVLAPVADEKRTTSEAAWCRVVRLMNEPEPPEVKAELDAKEIDACRNLECDHFAARMSLALRDRCSSCKNKGLVKK